MFMSLGHLGLIAAIRIVMMLRYRKGERKMFSTEAQNISVGQNYTCQEWAWKGQTDPGRMFN